VGIPRLVPGAVSTVPVAAVEHHIRVSSGRQRYLEAVVDVHHGDRVHLIVRHTARFLPWPAHTPPHVSDTRSQRRLDGGVNGEPPRSTRPHPAGGQVARLVTRLAAGDSVVDLEVASGARRRLGRSWPIASTER
jgi:hypothetical protein